MRRAERTDGQFLSFNQEKRLLLEELARTRSVPFVPFSIPFVLRRHERVQPAELERALNALVERHSVLRTSLIPAHDVPPSERRARLDFFAATGILAPGLYRQIVIDEAHLELRRAKPESDEIRPVIEAEMNSPFDYARPPLIRAVLVETGENCFLVLTIPHIAADLWSLQIIHAELDQLYAYFLRSGPYPPEPRFSYAQFASAQHASLETPEFRRALRHWEEQWSSFGEAQLRYRDLPFALRKPETPSLAEGVETLVIDSEQSKRLREFARKSRVTLYMLMLGAFAAVLHGSTHKAEITVWGSFRNRTAETERVVGWFANSHLLGIDCGGGITFHQLLGRVRAVVLNAIDHQRFPLSAIWPSFQRGAPRSDLTILFDLIETEDRPESEISAGIAPGFQQQHIPGVFMKSHVGLAVCVFETGREIRIQATYSADRFPAASIRAILEGMHSQLEAGSDHRSSDLLLQPVPLTAIPADPADTEQESGALSYAEWQLIYQTDWGS